MESHFFLTKCGGFGRTTFDFAPMVMTDADWNLPNPAQQTVFPAAFREYWGRVFMRWTTCTASSMAQISNETDSRTVFANGLVLGVADGSARFVQAQRFLADTPLASEYAPLPTFNQCGVGSKVIRGGITNRPKTNIDYPMWGLSL